MSYPIPNRVPLPVRRPDPQVMMAQGQPMAQPGGAFPQAPAQPPQQRRGLMDMASQNPEFFLSLGAGLLGGRTGREQWSGGLSGAAQALGTAKEKKDAKAKENATLKWLQLNAPEYADAVAQGVLSAGDAYKMHAEAKKPKKPNFINAGGGRLFNEDTGEWISAPEGMGGGTDYGLNPQYGIDENGNPALIQLGKDGTAKRTPLPEGITLSKEPIKMDAGTHFVLLDPITRQPVGMIPKENRQEAFDKGLGGAEGKAAGEAAGSYRSIESKMPGLEAVVERLGELADKATYTYAGQGLDAGMRQLGMEPREAAVARTEYQAMVDNQVLPMLRDTFGAAFTVKEGETLRATLGDLNKSPTERKAILKAFIEQKRRDVEALGRQSGVEAPQSAPQGAVQSYRDYFGGN